MAWSKTHCKNPKTQKTTCDTCNRAHEDTGVLLCTDKADRRSLFGFAPARNGYCPHGHDIGENQFFPKKTLDEKVDEILSILKKETKPNA